MEIAKTINIYCDESNHLLKSPTNTGETMVLGAILCPSDLKEEALKRIREIKEEHEISRDSEIKWTKVSKSKIKFYFDLINYFFDNTNLGFRAVIIDKTALNHQRYNQTHDQWYYKMYFTLLEALLSPNQSYRVFIDIKDTRGGDKIKKLQEVLCNSKYDFNREILKDIRQIRSEESELLQLADLFAGALQYKEVKGQSEAKKSILNKLRERSGYSLSKSTLRQEKKFNLFFWEGGHNGQ